MAMAASLLLVLSDSVQLLRVAVVVALWAATVGAIAMTKYRRESALDKAKVDDLKTVYELQLEREIAARREYELTVEEKVRSELRIDADEMAALRTELAALRRNLEVLFDGRLPEDGVALQATAERVKELAGRPVGADAGGPVKAPKVTAPRPAGPAFASPDDEPLTAETTEVSPHGTAKDEAATVGGGDGEPVGRRSRRRRAEGEPGGASQGRTVAEIMAALSAER